MQPELTTSDPFPLAPLTYARRAEPAELPELMDSPCGYEEFRSFLRDLTELNHLTRAYSHTLAFLDRITDRITARITDRITAPIVEPHTPQPRPLRIPDAAPSRPLRIPDATPSRPLRILDATQSRPLRILDVGSGGGDTLVAIAHWAAARNLPVSLTGIDLNPHSTRAARSLNSHDPLAAGIDWINTDVFAYQPNPQPDVIISALFTHHLSSPEIVRFLSWMEQHARLGWFINDLYRSRRAAFWFRFLPILLGWHHFIQYDGPVSLRRAFVPEDWQRMLAQANIAGAVIESHPMNRLCVARMR